MHLISRKSCRVCGSKALTPVIDLGSQYLQGSFVKPGKEDPPKRQIPMSLVRCDPGRDEMACGLLQMEHTVPPEILYSAYWYRSGTNATMRGHLTGIVRAALAIVGKDRGNVLDIGCNDGTLLKEYPGGFTKYGVDPSDVAQEIDKNEVTVIQGVFPSNELVACLQDVDGEIQTRMDVITSIAMFYDLEDPVLFTRGIKQILAPDGVWVFEMSYMPMMLEMTAYDTICHEHLEYYSLAVIEHVLAQGGLKVFDVELNSINGGSLRCYATHTDNFVYKKPEYQQNRQAMHQAEFDLMLDTDKPYKNFQDRINLHRDELQSLLRKLKKDGKSIHIYGASTKGNTILQWCGIDNRIIDCAAERNPDKYGAHTLGTDIPIVSEAESRAMKPDYYLVLPWHFKEEFIERERETLARGTQLIFPLPSIEVVSRDGVSRLRG
jgi:SAM-dependent methyltransferase